VSYQQCCCCQRPPAAAGWTLRGVRHSWRTVHVGAQTLLRLGHGGCSWSGGDSVHGAGPTHGATKLQRRWRHACSRLYLAQRCCERHTQSCTAAAASCCCCCCCCCCWRVAGTSRSRFCPREEVFGWGFRPKGDEVRHLFLGNNSLFRRGYLGRRPPQLPRAKKRVISEKQVPKNETAPGAFLNLNRPFSAVPKPPPTLVTRPKN
jgi:hypothetical protein